MRNFTFRARSNKDKPFLKKDVSFSENGTILEIFDPYSILI